MTTWNPAQEIKRPDLGNLDIGAVADIALFSELRGQRDEFGFVDAANFRITGDTKIVAELTLREGEVILNTLMPEKMPEKNDV